MTKLAEHYIRFSVKGLEESERDVEQTARKVMSTWSQLQDRLAATSNRAGGLFGGIAKGAGQILGPVTSAGGSVASAIVAGISKARSAIAGLASDGAKAIKGLATFAAPAAGLLAFARAAAQGTIEGQRLATAWDYLSRSIGSIFAPAVRIASAVLVGIGDLFNSLSPTTKYWVAGIALSAAGLVALSGAVTVVGIAFGGLATAAGIAWAIISSPAVLVIAGIAAVGAAVGALLGYMGSNSETAADSMNTANKSWIGYLIDAAGWITVAFAKAFNWMMVNGAKASDWIAEKLAQAGEMMGILEEGITDEVRRMPKIDPIQIDIKKLKEGFEAASAKVIPKFKDLKAGALAIGEELGGLPGMLGRLMEMKFHPTLDVKFEGLQQSWDRLQEAFARGTPEDQVDQIREDTKAIRELLQKILDKGKNALAPAVGP